MSKIKDRDDRVPWLLSARLWLSIFTFLGFVLLYSQRVGMSMAIICMVNHTYVDLQINELDEDNITNGNYENGTFSIDDDATCILKSSNETMQDGPFNWSKRMQGHLLGAFFYGYVLSQIPSGLLTQRFGTKWVYAAFYGLSTLATLLTPPAARIHYGLAIFVRVLSGIGIGAAFPAMHTLWGHWAPPLERSMLSGINYAGVPVANAVTMPISGLLCESGFDGGWSSIFYVTGAFSLIWLLLWITLVSETPVNCRLISRKEKVYITDNTNIGDGHNTSKQFKLPWLSVVTSLPVWAIIVANITSDWCVYTMLTGIPLYMHEVLKYDIQMNGFLSALPFIAAWVGVGIFSFLSDKLISSNTCSTVTIRKTMNTISLVVPASCLIAVSFIDCHRPYVAVTLLSLAMTFLSASMSGYLVNHLDIAPQYAGTLIGLTNSVAASMGFISPYLTAVLTPNQTREEWQTVFFVSAAIQVTGAVFYVIFASGVQQHWAVERNKPTELSINIPRDIDSQEKEIMILT